MIILQQPYATSPKSLHSYRSCPPTISITSVKVSHLPHPRISNVSLWLISKYTIPLIVTMTCSTSSIDPYGHTLRNSVNHTIVSSVAPLYVSPPSRPHISKHLVQQLRQNPLALAHRLPRVATRHDGVQRAEGVWRRLLAPRHGVHQRRRHAREKHRVVVAVHVLQRGHRQLPRLS